MPTLKIIKPGLRETGSIGDGIWNGETKLWFVALRRDDPPYRGQYEADEVEQVEPEATPDAR